MWLTKTQKIIIVIFGISTVVCGIFCHCTDGKPSFLWLCGAIVSAAGALSTTHWGEIHDRPPTRCKCCGQSVNHTGHSGAH